MNFDFAQTCLTVHRAAPVEFAHAPLRPSLSVAPVAPVAAQQVAAINRLRSLVAGTAVGAEGASFPVKFAIIGRAVEVDQIGVGVRLVSWTSGH